MTDREFVDTVAQLRRIALGAAQMAPTAAEDVAQDTLLRLWTMRSSIATPQQARSLCHIVARHGAIAVLRRERRHVPIESAEWAAADADADSQLHLSEQLSWLARRMELLPRTSRLILDLR